MEPVDNSENLEQQELPEEQSAAEEVSQLGSQGLNLASSVANFGKGFAAGAKSAWYGDPKDNLATGIKDVPSNQNDINEGSNKKNDDNNLQKDNGLNNDNDLKNNDSKDKKNLSNSDNQNNSNSIKQNDKKDSDNNFFNNMPGVSSPNKDNNLNPLDKDKKPGGLSNLDNDKKEKGAFDNVKNGANDLIKKITGKDKDSKVSDAAKTAVSATPVGAFITKFKVIAIVGGISFVLIAGIVGLMLVLGVSVGTVAMAGMCDTNNSNVTLQNYGDEMEFLCKMQDPLADKSVYEVHSICGFDVDATHAGRWHEGIDLSTYGNANSNVYAAQSGEVVAVHDGCERAPAACSTGAGNYIVIKHGDVRTKYFHLLKGSIQVKEGQIVGKGQLLAKVGSTGSSSGEHLHFEVHKSATKDDPVVAINDYFLKNDEFKAKCGSMWDGENAGDSANIENTAGSYNTSTLKSNSNCCLKTSYSGSNSSDKEGLPSGITEEILDAVISAQSGSNIPVSITLAQYLLESGVEGNSALVTDCNGLFGVKGKGTAGSCYLSTWEQLPSGEKVIIKADFRKYNNLVESIEDHMVVLQQECYTKKNLSTKEEWATALNYQNCGYATDQAYTEKILSMIDTYRLDRFDGITSYNSCSLGGPGTFNGKIWDYSQSDPKWGSVSYCGGTLASHGCGATSMAMIVSTFYNKEHNPVELAGIAKESGYCSTNSWSYFEYAAKKYNINFVRTKDANEVLTALNRGDSLVIANVQEVTINGLNNFWTAQGHYIVLAGHSGDDVWVQDPNKDVSGNYRSNTKGDAVYSFSTEIAPATTNYGIFSLK